jgi:hypothetical protein
VAVGGSLEPRGGAQRLGRRRALAEGGAHRGGGACARGAKWGIAFISGRGSGVWESFSSKQGRRGEREDGSAGEAPAAIWLDDHARGSASLGGFPLGRRAGAMMASVAQPTGRGSGR